MEAHAMAGNTSLVIELEEGLARNESKRRLRNRFLREIKVMFPALKVYRHFNRNQQPTIVISWEWE